MDHIRKTGGAVCLATVESYAPTQGCWYAGEGGAIDSAILKMGSGGVRGRAVEVGWGAVGGLEKESRVRGERRGGERRWDELAFVLRKDKSETHIYSFAPQHTGLVLGHNRYATAYRMYSFARVRET